MAVTGGRGRDIPNPKLGSPNWRAQKWISGAMVHVRRHSRLTNKIPCFKAGQAEKSNSSFQYGGGGGGLLFKMLNPIFPTSARACPYSNSEVLTQVSGGLKIGGD